ncbi:MAG TPA: hypothetical protein VNX68_15210, partial [Nitrosopumilaceae archaeon]|nr:hypothetical protein [Nitrosopumilaceae archaeon]
ELIYGLGKYYHFIGSYQKAIGYYNRMFRFIEDNEDGKLIKKEIEQNIADCEFAMQHPEDNNSNRQRLKVENLGPEINSPYAEYTPVVDKNETVLLFTSRRKNNVGHRTDDDDLYYEDMYIARKNSMGKFSGAHQLSATDNDLKLLKNTRFNESFISISHDGSKLYTYRDNSIYESGLNNGVWSEPVKMDENINPYTYQNHASISSDGKTIYFTSNKKSGYGELDIYKSVKSTDGKWSAPENMGPDINTSGSEESPAISEDGKTLYFASKVLPGYGGYDLFKTTFNGTTWSKPENMGRPINSEGDDLFLNIDDNGTHGFLASSRKGGLGDLDLYRIFLLDRFTDAET